VQLIFQPGRCADTRRALADGLLNLGFLLEEPVQPPQLVVEPLIRERLVLLAPAGHRLSTLERVGPADLQGEPLLVTEAGCSYREFFERALSTANAVPATTLEFSSVEAIKQCVMAGMGLTILPEVAVAAEVAQGRLVILPWAGPTYNLVTQLAWHKDKWLSPALQAFLEITRAALRPEPQPLAVGLAAATAVR
jgi:DNA-binding transcriptional LysR family regulator